VRAGGRAGVRTWRAGGQAAARDSISWKAPSAVAFMKPREHGAPQCHGVLAHYGELGLRRLDHDGGRFVFGMCGDRYTDGEEPAR